MYSQLEALPEELLGHIFSKLSHAEQCNTALASWRCYHMTVPLLYQSIDLVDRCNLDGWDEHDDTPMIRILLVLIKNPYLASKVQTLTHHCHFPLPDPFDDLPALSLSSPTLSCDSRTSKLLQLAIKNLVNVHTLRIIFGHHNITKGLLRGFFDPSRIRDRPVVRLWLESCCLEDICIPSTYARRLTDLRSIRIRRLRARREDLRIGDTILFFRNFGEMSRYSTPGRYRATITSRELRLSRSNDTYFQKADALDDAIYQRFEEVDELVSSDLDMIENPGGAASQDRSITINEDPVGLISHLLASSSSTLSSLNLDWVLDGALLIEDQWIYSIHFPNLRAFQVRNAVLKDTRFSAEPVISLLKGCWLDFMERHPRIQCLAWPLESFCSHLAPSAKLSPRAKNVVTTLGRNLTELRVDAEMSSKERHTELEVMDPRPSSRRSFIEQVAPHLATLETLKIEGGIPYDERSELVRAVSSSPLRKLVVIGASFPAGDTWAPLPKPLRRALRYDQIDIRVDIHTDKSMGFPHVSDTDEEWASRQVEALSPSFVPTFNPSKYPILETIALHHASTIKSLKFCGFNGAPYLHYPSSFTSTLLAPLRHLHKLQHLTMAFWIPTFFEDSQREDQIISYWLDAQSSTSTALAMPNNAELENTWAKVLVEYHAPAKLAEKVANVVVPHLSKPALGRPGGMLVKALFLLGSHDLFDLDIELGAHGQVLTYIGPKAENHPEKIREKLENRAWF